MTRRHFIAAFSLIEVLISIVVLALGMLGLGAVIPVVVREQRIATEQVFGTSVLQSAEAFLSKRGALYEPVLYSGVTLSPLAHWRDESDNRGGLDFSNNGVGNESEWGTWVSPEIDQDTGDLVLPPATDGGPKPIDLAGRIRIQDRLFPEPHTGGEQPETRSEPQYVWDFVGRRVYEPDPYQQGTSGLRPTGAVQFAIFVRTVDAGLRVPEGERLSSVLTGGGRVTPSKRRPAVAVGSTGNLQGLPVPASTPNTSVEYSVPIVVPVARNVRFNPAATDRTQRPDRLALRVDQTADNGTNTVPRPGDVFRLLSQTGQKLVDSLGNVYTVTGVEDADGWIVRIDPPVPSNVYKSDDLVSVAFVPQIPIAVSVLAVEP